MADTQTKDKQTQKQRNKQADSQTAHTELEKSGGTLIIYIKMFGQKNTRKSNKKNFCN